MTSVPTVARPLDLVAAEWIKLRSLRSTYLVLLTGVTAAFAIGLLVCNADASQWTHVQPGQPSPIDPMADSFVGFSVAQLLFAAVGVLTVTGEYSSGLIRTTLAAVPARGAMLAAKAAVVFTVTASVGFVVALATFAGGQAILSRQHLGISLSHPGAARAVIAAGVYLAAVALLGMGLGAAIRNAAGALSVAVALLFLAPSLLPTSSRWLADIANVLPANAIRRLASLHPWPHAPSVTQSIVVIVAYPVVALAVAAYLIHRRDA